MFETVNGSIKKIFDYKGRASLREYWIFSLYFVGMYFLLAILGTMMFDRNFINFILNVFTIWMSLVSLSLAVRRMHDQDRSGWWLLVPVASLIMTAFISGSPGKNKYGPKPAK